MVEDAALKIQTKIRGKLARTKVTEVKKHRERRQGAEKWEREITRVAERQAALRTELKEGGVAAVRGSTLMDNLVARFKPAELTDVATFVRGGVLKDEFQLN